MTKLHKKKFSLNSKRRVQYGITIVLSAIVAFAILGALYHVQRDKDLAKAQGHGERIVTNIRAQLGRLLDASEMLNVLYRNNSGESSFEFDLVCEELTKGNAAISGLYWAPLGVVQWAYPKHVADSAMYFRMLDDPIQSQKARYAVESHRATVAGPHMLVEGGKGIIVRNPNYNENNRFISFSIVVADFDRFVQQITESLDSEELEYRFSVWKAEDPTAVTDEEGYIFSSDTPIADRKVIVPFQTLNDEWFLTLEPKAGWSPWQSMRTLGQMVLCCLMLFWVLMFIVMRNRQMGEDLEQLELETERRQTAERHQRELEKARDLANAANAAKTSFLFNMSHDIRTPMNAIMGFTKLLRKHQDEPERRESYLNKIESASAVMLSIINNVLEMARIEKGTVVIDEVPCNVRVLAQTLKELVHEMMKEKNLQFSYTIQAEHPYVYGDLTKMREILINILSNAYKYTLEGGKVTMTIEELPTNRPGYVRFRNTIKDTGIGMDPDFLPHIFEEFSREENTTSSKIEGTGLGMPIVKRLVELLGGTITVESKKGEGSTFVVETSHRIANAADLPEQTSVADLSQKTFEGKRLLLAEDNDLNAEIATEILNEAGFIIERACDGQQAVEMLTQAPANYYCAILMDIQMPRMNGYEATRTIRQLPDEAQAHIPILAMTANAFEEDRREALKAGMNAHLSKPINLIEMMKALSKYVGRT